MNTKGYIVTLFLLLLTVSCAHQSDDKRLYSASENSCNKTCGFNHESSQECASRESALYYIYHVLFTTLAKASRLIENEPANTCVCAEATLKKEGLFSNVTILKSNSINASNIVKNYLDNVKFSAVPESATCLLDKPINPIPISLDNNS